MRKVLGFSCLVCLLVVGLACSGDSSTPTAPATNGSELTSATGAVKPPKDLICHYNAADDPYGVVVEVSSKNLKRHKDHLDSEQDCYVNLCWELEPNDQCIPTNCGPCF